MKIMTDARKIIEALDLKPLAEEGGYYKETYRSEGKIGLASLPDLYSSDRSCGTAIYYLLTPDTYSALHRLPGDEIFHFYLGDPVEMLMLHGYEEDEKSEKGGKGEIITLGQDILNGERPQVVVHGGVWQGAYLRDGGKFALLGTTMAPGFDFADFQTADPAQLEKAYPDYKEIIHRLSPIAKSSPR
jgi:uncharacterized protein